MIEEELQEAMSRGVAWLDKTTPGWLGDLTLSTFDFRSKNDGILGQLFGPDLLWAEASLAHLGFMLPNYTLEQLVDSEGRIYELEECWTILETLWCKYIVFEKYAHILQSRPIT